MSCFSHLSCVYYIPYKTEVTCVIVGVQSPSCVNLHRHCLSHHCPNPLVSYSESSRNCPGHNSFHRMERDDVEEEYLRGFKDNQDDMESEASDARQPVSQVRALCDYNGQQEDDLSFQEKDILDILEACKDGWWVGRNKDGETGFIPSTLVEIVKYYEDDEVEEEEGDGTEQDVQPARSGKELWKNLQGKASQNKTSVVDVLKAMKGFPSGFRRSTLGRLFLDSFNRTSSWVALVIDPLLLELGEQELATTRTLSLVSTQSIPTLGPGLEVTGRYVYMALWNGKDICSNIHLVRALPIQGSLTWTFTPKVAKVLPTLYDGDVIVRQSAVELVLLFELCFSYLHKSSGESQEISCGWTSLNLTNETSNKSHQLPVHGGTPYESGVPLDDTKTQPTSLFQSLSRTNNQPRLVVKTTSLSKLERVDVLPSSFVTCQKYSTFVGFYREHFSSVICTAERHVDVCDPLLSYFPRSLDQSDIMDALLYAWNERIKANRSQRRAVSNEQLFKTCFYDTPFALMQSAHLCACEDDEKARYAFILEFLQRKTHLLSADCYFMPVSIQDLCWKPTSVKTTQR